MQGNQKMNNSQSLKNKKLILMRGLPASGKSYRAKELCEDNESIICSADHFFGYAPEEYLAKWSFQNLGIAHNYCREKAKSLMEIHVPLVIIDNTNTTIKEMLPYVEMAIFYGYEIQVEEPCSEWWKNKVLPFIQNKSQFRIELDLACEDLFERSKSSHKVPLETIKKMMHRYEPNLTTEKLLERRSY
jgi:hypothetical protein